MKQQVSSMVADGQILLLPNCPKPTTQHQLDLVPVKSCSHLRVDFFILSNPPHSRYLHLGPPPLLEHQVFTELLVNLIKQFRHL